MLTPAFHFKILEEFFPVFGEQSRILIKILNEKFADGKVFDIFPYITRCALDTICGMCCAIIMIEMIQIKVCSMNNL